MHKFATVSTLFLSLACASLPALAADTPFKPGLWEISNTPSGAGGSQLQAMMAAAQQQLKAMDPAQRAKVDAAMARNGVVIENGSMRAKVCITPAMAARQQMPIQQKGNCTSTFSPMKGNTIDYAVTCTSPAARSEGTATFSSPTAYTAVTRMSSSEAGGASMTVDSTGRWLGADCGAIAPPQMSEK